MKILAIRHIKNTKRVFGYVLYFEKTKTFFIELETNLNPVKMPIVLDIFYTRKIYSINDYYSKLWLKDRVVPIDRQNIGQILKDAKLKEYDLYKLLVLNNGRCTNDDFELVPIDYVPEIVEKRFKYKVNDVVPLSDNKILCFFFDGSCRRIDINVIRGNDRKFIKVLSDSESFNKVSVLSGGYGITFNNDLNISDNELYKAGEKVNIKYEEMLSFVQNNIVDSYEASQLLNCSRQNISDLVKREKLKAIKQGKKNNLFVLKDIKNRIDF